MPYKAKSDLTKAAIKKSFLALLNEKPINQISVRDIAEGLWLQQKHDLLSL